MELNLCVYGVKSRDQKGKTKHIETFHGSSTRLTFTSLCSLDLGCPGPPGCSAVAWSLDLGRPGCSAVAWVTVFTGSGLSRFIQAHLSSVFHGAFWE